MPAGSSNLSLIINIIQSSDCTQLFLIDNTGAYSISSNPGGYGSPNPALAQVTSVTVSGTIYLPNGSTIPIPSTTLFPTGVTPVFNLNQAWVLTTTLLGINGNTFPDGIYQLTYTVNSQVSATQYSNSVQYQQLITCNADCCIGNVLSDLDPCDCGCQDVCKAFEMFAVLQAAKAACGATMNSKALDLLNAVVLWCGSQGCNCGCK